MSKTAVHNLLRCLLLMIVLACAGCSAAPPPGEPSAPIPTEALPLEAAPSLEELEELEDLIAQSSCVVSFVDAFGLVEIAVEAPAERLEYGPGSYRVGRDLAADIYFLVAHDGRTGLATVKESANPFAATLLREEFTSHTILQLAAGQKLTLRDATMIHLGYSRDYFDLVAAGPLGEGMYLVGYHIIPGAYDLLLDADTATGRVVSYEDAGRAVTAREKEFSEDSLYTAFAGQYIWLRGASLENIPQDPDTIHT